MSGPWYDENLYSWIPGTALGVLGGLWGSLVGMLAPRGRARGFVLVFTWALLVVSALLLVLGLVALFSGQPYGVWYGLGLAGLIGLVVVGANTFTVYWVYRAAEERKLAARDLTESAGIGGGPQGPSIP
ncbi:MAG TPA: hypothetical protein VMS17_30815 [Gemmataceae bacterium]|nr:hypothetical protein [Gemmataceae bacterium]